MDGDGRWEWRGRGKRKREREKKKRQQQKPDPACKNYFPNFKGTGSRTVTEVVIYILGAWETIRQTVLVQCWWRTSTVLVENVNSVCGKRQQSWWRT